MKRDAILQTALGMFAEKGFAGTSTASLAKRAKVAEGTIFRHFSGKEAIFSEILVTLYHSIKRDFEAGLAASNSKNGLDTLLFAISSFMSFAAKNRDYLAIFFNDAPARYDERDSEVFKETASIYTYISEFIAGQLAAGQKDGSIRTDLDAKSASVLICCTVVGLTRARHFSLMDTSDACLKQSLDSMKSMLKS